MMNSAVLNVLIVDDEAPARERLRGLLGDIYAQRPTRIVGMAANGVEALRLIEAMPVDMVLTDINMPVMDGIELAQLITRLNPRPHVMFVTAYDEYAIQAFELNAIDYLLKPVRTDRLLQGLNKVQHTAPVKREQVDVFAEPRRHLVCSERGKIHLVGVHDVLYLKAELKYVTACTVERDFLLDESLVQLEQEFADIFVRIHRNCLVSRQQVLGFERLPATNGGEGGWAVRVNQLSDPLPVSRRQWATVRQVLGG